jgi:hypothetical protein
MPPRAPPGQATRRRPWVAGASEQRQRPRGQHIARPSGHRIPARGRPAPPPGRLAHRPVPSRYPRCHPRRSHRRQPGRQRHALPRLAHGRADAGPTASASSPATERRWTPEQFSFLEVWTSRSSPCRPLIRTAPTRREPLGAHHHRLPDRPAPSRRLPGATRAGTVRASAADAFAREAHRSAMLPADRSWRGDRT